LKLRIYICLLAALLPGMQHIYAQGLYIPSGGQVIAPAASHIATAQKFVNNGTFTHNGTLYFTGTTQAINGTTATAFNNIVINNGSTTTINATGQTLKRVLLCDGTLQAGGNLTLLSTPAQTALIDGAGTGDVLGNVTMQRYIDTAYGYKYISSPFQYSLVGELSDELDLEASFPPLYRYDETVNSTGWHFYTNAADTLYPMSGYAANFGTAGDALTADITGVVNNGAVATTIYNNNQTYTQGFNLLGNPYPSPIDWDAGAGWGRSNIDDAIYYFDAGASDEYTGTYSSYINGISSDGIANNIIPSMQGFFVHVSDGSYPVTGTLSMNNSVRVNNFTAVYHKQTADERPLIRLSAKYVGAENASDPVALYFNDDASMAYDKAYDALKLMNTDGSVPNLYINVPGGAKLSVSSMPAPADSISIVPLGIKAEKDGLFLLDVKTMNNIPAGTRVYLGDAQQQKITELNTSTQYYAQLKAGTYNNRFSLIFSKNNLPDKLFATNLLNAYSGKGMIYVYLNFVTGDKGGLVISNTLGQVVYRHEISGLGYHEIPAPFTNGIYIVSFYSQNGIFSNKLIVGDN
jgi:hypothetical protein